MAAARLSRGQWTRAWGSAQQWRSKALQFHSCYSHTHPVGEWGEGELHSDPKNGRWGAGIIFSHFTLSELAFGWKNHPQGTLWADSSNHAGAQPPPGSPGNSQGGTLRASLPDSTAGRAGVSPLPGMLQPCNLLVPLLRLGGGSVAQRVCKAVVSPRAQTLHQLSEETGRPVAGMFTQP